MSARYKYDAVAELVKCGISWDDAVALQRISRTLRGWFVHECNGEIQRDEVTSIPYWYNTVTGQRLFRAPDRQAGAMKRLTKIMARYPSLKHYVQGDPRGCALYILRQCDVPDGYKNAGWEVVEVESYYSNGVAVA